MKLADYIQSRLTKNELRKVALKTQANVTGQWAVGFLGSCLLEGKDSVERLDRELKLQTVFYLAKLKESMLQRQEIRLTSRVGSCQPGFTLSFYGDLFGFLPPILSFLHHPLDLPWFLSLSLLANLCFSFFP